MQDPKTPHARKAWYQRAMDMATTWRSIPKPSDNNIPRPPPPTKIWKTVTKGIAIAFPTTLINISSSNNGQQRRLRKCSSLGVARVCLCAPISYTEIFRPPADHIPPRRSNSYPRSKSMSSGAGAVVPTTTTSSSSSSPRPSVEMSRRRRTRAVFRGKSLTEDALMRRFVMEEEAMMQVRRRDQMEVIRRRSLMRRRNKLGPSPLSTMLRAQD